MGESNGTDESARTHVRQHHAPRTPPRILVVEDDSEMRRLIVTALERDGYAMQEAADGVSVLGRIVPRHEQDQLAVDLVISDLRIPRGSGMQVLKGLRRAGWGVPFILITAFGGEQAQTEAEELGAFFLAKPFNLSDLRSVVAGIFDPDAVSAQ